IEVLFSSRMMSMQSSTHSSQMNTVGPAISLRTSCWLLPQNEQYRVFLESPPPLLTLLMLSKSFRPYWGPQHAWPFRSNIMAGTRPCQCLCPARVCRHPCEGRYCSERQRSKLESYAVETQYRLNVGRHPFRGNSKL